MIIVQGTMSVANTKVTPAAKNNDKEVVFKNSAPLTDCISEINNTYIDDGKDNDVVMPRYNVTQYSDNYSKTSGSLWQYYRD